MSNKRLSARRVVTTSLLVDVSDIILNVIAAILSGSVVMLTQTLRGAADLITTLLLWVGVYRSRRKADRTYHFGYGRELYFWILMSGVSMFVLTAGLSIYFGIERLIEPHPIDNLLLANLVLLIGLAANGYALSLSVRRLGLLGVPIRRAVGLVSQSNLIETKSTLIMDAMGSLASLLGLVALLLFRLTGNIQFDGAGAVIVGVVSGVFAVGLIQEVKEAIVGRSALPEVEIAIKEATEKLPDVVRVLDLKTMQLGTEELLVNMEVHLEPHLNTADIESLMDGIKQQVKRHVPEVKHIQVEVETPRGRRA